MKKQSYLAIDPGKNGGISIIRDDGTLFTATIPSIKKEVDLNSLYKILLVNKDVKHCVLEDVHSVFGASSKANFQFGWINGILEGMVISLGIPYTKINPKMWQKEMWQGIRPLEINTGKKMKDGSPKMKVDTKATSLLAAKRLFPQFNFTATERSKKDHDGLIDASLMAEYCRRKFR